MNYHELHKQLWDWLSKNKGIKSDWPRWEENGGDIENSTGSHCFACNQAYEQVYGDEDIFPAIPDMAKICKKCPIDWAGDGTFKKYACERSGMPVSLYVEWTTALAPEERTMYAELIRDLEWRGK